ncbi:calcium ATPase, partial [Martensiomyces pterosporus]
VVLSGSELVGLQPEHWDIICSYSEVVFARTTPEQKLLIVQELRSRDNYVAVTGDGVNDSPALKAAHIGVAMGGGSEVAKEAADMVLLDNNFSSILVAIENGRLVFENLKKVVLYLMPAGSFSEFVPMFLNMVLGVPLPLSVIFMIVICMLTDVWASISLMYESPESDIMFRAPRNPKKEHLVNLKFFGQAYGFIGILESLFAHIIFFVYMYWYGGFTPKDLFLAFDKWTLGGFGGKDQDTLNNLLNTGESIFFLSLVILQWGNMFATRTRRLSVFQQNPFWGPTRNLRLLIAIPFTLGITFIFCYIGWFNNIFGTANIPVAFFFIPLPFALVILCLDEIRKLVVRLRPTGLLARIACQVKQKRALSFRYGMVQGFPLIFPGPSSADQRRYRRQWRGVSALEQWMVPAPVPPGWGLEALSPQQGSPSGSPWS